MNWRGLSLDIPVLIPDKIGMELACAQPVYREKDYICGKHKEVDMATYTITIDERTKSGKQVLNYLKSHGVIEIPNETTRKAIQEIRDGKGIRCKTIEEFIESLK